MGGTRMIGLEVVARLLENDHDVVLFNRGTRDVAFPRPVTEVRGDRYDPSALEQLGSLRLEAIVDLSAYTSEQTALVLEALPEVERFVHCSTGAVYQPQPELPWAEDTPEGPWALWGTYAIEKLQCERLLRQHRRADLSTTIIRLPYVLGPANYAPREEFVLNRLLDAQEVYLPGDGKAVQQFISSAQVGDVFAAAVSAAGTPGVTPFNVAADELVSLEGFVDICASVAGVDPLRRAVGGGATGTGAAVFDASDPVFPFPNENYALDVTAARQAGLAPGRRRVREMIELAFETLLADPERRKWERTQAERQVAARLETTPR